MRNWFLNNAFHLIVGSIALVAVGLIVWAVSSGAGGASVQPALSASSSSDEHDGEHEHDHEGEEEIFVNDTSCDKHATSEEYASFLDRVREYELAYQNPPSKEWEEKLKLLTTQQYQSDHGFGQNYSESDTIVELLEDTIITCNLEEDGSRNVSTLPTISTYFINSDGEKETIIEKLVMPLTHTSVWVSESGEWRVHTETD